MGMFGVLTGSMSALDYSLPMLGTEETQVKAVPDFSVLFLHKYMYIHNDLTTEISIKG